MPTSLEPSSPPPPRTNAVSTLPATRASSQVSPAAMSSRRSRTRASLRSPSCANSLVTHHRRLPTRFAVSQRVGVLDVHVVVVDRGGDRDRVAGEPVDVVERGPPVVRREQRRRPPAAARGCGRRRTSRGRSSRRSAAAGARRARTPGARPGPAAPTTATPRPGSRSTRAAARRAGASTNDVVLLDRDEELVGQLVARPAPTLEQVVQLLEPVAHAERVAELLQPLDRERVARRAGARRARRGGRRRRASGRGRRGSARRSARRGRAPARTSRRRPRPAPRSSGGSPPVTRTSLQPLGRQRQVGHGAEAAVALPEDRPWRLADERRPQHLRVAHDRVGPEVREVVGLLLGRAEPGEGLPGGGCRPAGAALVEQQHAVVLQGATQPAGAAGRARRPAARTALQEEQPRQVLVALARRDHLAGEHRDRAPRRARRGRAARRTRGR